MNYITSLLLLSSNTFLHPTTTYLQSMNDSIVLVTSSVSTELTALAYDPISTISGVNGTNNIDYIKLLNDTNSTFVQLIIPIQISTIAHPILKMSHPMMSK